jgi:hypothetical protein
MKTNRLIAKFMGARVSDDGYRFSFPMSDNDERIQNVLGSPITFGNEYERSCYASDLKYDSSWDWLMPAVDKIEGMTDSKGDAYRFNTDMCNVDIEGTDIQIIGEAYKIVAVYRAVVEFINRYTDEKIN